MRRAIQLGLRGQALADYGRRELLEVIDLTEFVAEQRVRLQTEGPSSIETPIELPYVPKDATLVRRLAIDRA